jgi:CubicO group peptidase (beta-lactamase class C family)
MDHDSLEELMHEYREGQPGASVLVVREGAQLIRWTGGMADIESGVSATPATNYRLASVSKAFTAAAILLLVEQGVLSLDSPVRQWLPPLPMSAAGVTLRQLLTHTSGLIDYEDLIAPGTAAQVHDIDVLKMLAAEPRLYFPPGSAYRYSNGAYALLALIVELASGMSYATFLRKRIFEPLAMKGTLAHEEGVSTVAHRAYGYTRVGNEWRRTDQDVTSAVLGDGGVYSSIDDLAKWDAALYDDRLLRPESIRLAFTPATSTDDPATSYGFGWRLTGETVWHSGESVGFRNVIVRWPKRRLTAIVLTNRNAPEPYPLALRLAGLALER